MASPKTVWYISVLLILCCSLEKQDCLETPNVTSEFLQESLTDGSQVPYSENITDKFKDFVRTNLTTLLVSKVPFINTTTAFHLNITVLKCICKNQYSWSCNQSLYYGSCDNTTDDSCGCIKDIPPDGQFCQPITNLTACPSPTSTAVPSNISEGIFEIELDTTYISVTLIDALRASVNGLTYPVLISNVLSVTEVNFTTACYPNSTCTCEDQYSWSCDQCSSYGSCDDIIDGSCGCIKDIPPDGQFCQPITNLTACSTPYTTPVPTSKQSTANPATPTTTSSNTSIPTTKQPTESTITTTPTVPTSKQSTANSATPTTTSSNTSMPTSKQSTANSATPTTTSSNTSSIIESVIVTKPTALNLEFTMTIDFDSAFNDENSAMFKDINQTINDIYKRNMQGFISAKLNGFKSGSVIADFTVRTTVVDNVEIAKAKADIVSTLGEKYNIRIICSNNPIFGSGQVNEIVKVDCKSDEVGYKTAICQKNGTFSVQENNCVLKEIENLFVLSQALVGNSLPVFLERLRNSTLNLLDRIVTSPATISTVVNILQNVANVSRSTPINKPLMTNFLETAGVLTSNGAKDSWEFLNNNLTKSENSDFLGTIETISNSLTNGSFDIKTSSIILNKTTLNNSINNSFNLNSSVLIDIPASEASFNSITIITFDSLDNVLPARNSSSVNNSVNSINGKVVLVKVNATIKNVTFSFNVLDKTLVNPQCVFWNFSLFDGLGGWDGKGCELQSDKNGTVTCHCNHLTSFSILMSPFIPSVLRAALDFITYIGVAISMGCLVACLIIEILVWKAVTGNNTSYMRHVSIVNIAVSLLIADIWFIIGAAISEKDKTNLPACSTATFFIHFFYLALFFWMLVSGLLLLYRTVMVFSHMSKRAMLAISFSLGYGAPLIIAVITIAVTAPGEKYIRKKDGVCWLNWTESMALLAFVIPALTIVVSNLLILIVVLYKMLRRGGGGVTQPDERNAVVVIARCLAILTPFFGTTWGLGVGTMTNPDNLGIHIVFAIFNSLQGLFILVFGTLLDKKIREALTGRSQVSSNRTRTTSATASTSVLGFFRMRRRNVFNVAAVQTSSTTGSSEAFINT